MSAVLVLPTALGRYLLVEEIASGGMGAIFLALQRTGLHGVERLVVVKTILPELLAHDAIRARFLDEARTSLLLNHPNLCTTFDVQDATDAIVLAMEHIPGRDLRNLFELAARDEDLIEPDDVAAIAIGVLDGLEHAHDLVQPRTHALLGLVHRDISPQNVMISYTGAVKIIDFGVARSRLQSSRTQPGVFVGKARYSAPEQARGRDIDLRADLFSFAVVLVELFSGRRYYGDLEAGEIWQTLQRDAPYRSTALARVPAATRAVLELALDHDPHARFGNAAAFREALLAAGHAGARAPGRLRNLMTRLFPGAEEIERMRMRALLDQLSGRVPKQPPPHSGITEPDGIDARDVRETRDVASEATTKRMAPSPEHLRVTDAHQRTAAPAEAWDDVPTIASPPPVHVEDAPTAVPLSTATTRPATTNSSVALPGDVTASAALLDPPTLPQKAPRLADTPEPSGDANTVETPQPALSAASAQPFADDAPSTIVTDTSPHELVRPAMFTPSQQRPLAATTRAPAAGGSGRAGLLGVIAIVTAAILVLLLVLAQR